MNTKMANKKKHVGSNFAKEGFGGRKTRKRNH